MNWELLSWVGVIGYVLSSNIIWYLKTWSSKKNKLQSFWWIHNIFFCVGVTGFYFSYGIWISSVSIVGMLVGNYFLRMIIDFNEEKETKNFKEKSKFIDEQGVNYGKYKKSRFYDLLFVTTELEKEIKDREYLKIFKESGDGENWTKGRSSFERGQLKSIYLLTTIGLFLNKIKLLHGKEVDELIIFMCDYFDSKYFERTSITSKYLDINNSSFIKEIRNQKITESDKIEIVKMLFLLA